MDGAEEGPVKNAVAADGCVNAAIEGAKSLLAPEVLEALNARPEATPVLQRLHANLHDLSSIPTSAMVLSVVDSSRPRHGIQPLVRPLYRTSKGLTAIASGSPLSNPAPTAVAHVRLPSLPATKRLLFSLAAATGATQARHQGVHARVI
eukprot:scaffold1970_cov396-Prasinococcus_capsulatus_cf.AAC.27